MVYYVSFPGPIMDKSQKFEGRKNAKKKKLTYVVFSHPQKLINGSTLNQQPCAFFSKVSE